jgi:[ribosomal protein S5]-alanine N-acetyltransferase
VTTRGLGNAPLVLHGRRLLLRTLTTNDYEGWFDVRRRCADWLLKWEPRPLAAPHLADDRRSFNARCAVRDRERALGAAFGFGLFVGGKFGGEVTLSSIQRGPMQWASIGYWIDEALAGAGYIPEAVVAVLQFAFDALDLHRVEISIIPRNRASLRVVEKLQLRFEGVAERYLEIDGVWEDHARYAITVEEWRARAPELVADWLLPRD